ncbi:hypothetical protein [Thalassovita aquimarina]|uniref:Uncharacterized protein n=1 Tax=Thalassovita aquimarina TaxID=2785917 RepID=A0ABS5HSI4_9RHOB|nr:hypothetical protein [Thalassovita aquimarina]MBR9651940.1 hypothetical protein [Thalassovita aquimarina]
MEETKESFASKGLVDPGAENAVWEARANGRMLEEMEDRLELLEQKLDAAIRQTRNVYWLVFGIGLLAVLSGWFWSK